MLLVVGSTRGEATCGGCGFLFSFRPAMRRGRCAADTQNHTALQRARNRSKKLILRVLFAKELGCIISQYVGNVHQLAGITADTNDVTSIRQRPPRPVSTSPNHR